MQCDECDKPIWGVKGSSTIVQGLRQHCKAVHNFNRREVDDMLYRVGYYTEAPKSSPRNRQRRNEVVTTVGDGEEEE